jgi:hypothetical protein
MRAIRAGGIVSFIRTGNPIRTYMMRQFVLPQGRLQYEGRRHRKGQLRNVIESFPKSEFNKILTVTKWSEEGSVPAHPRYTQKRNLFWLIQVQQQEAPLFHCFSSGSSIRRQLCMLDAFCHPGPRI